jgi:hypothetical protein
VSDTSKKKIGKQQHYRGFAANVISSADCASIKSRNQVPSSDFGVMKITQAPVLPAVLRD